MNKRLATSYVIYETLNILGMAVALFWPAGRLDWWQAWGAVAVQLGWIVATAVIIFRFYPGLMADRMGRQKGGKRWDTIIVSSVGLITLVRYILAGLDHRYGWTGSFPLAVQVTALGLCALGYALFTWATASNAFFSRVVRIQSERGHAVVKSGPYRFVRHPAYFGAILYELAVPFLLSSWWCLIVSCLSAALLAVRTFLEDRTLVAELPGYADYTRQVRHRLLPGVW
jgi:protein-S-isoprenylcysteine O-methyltransferase Ste14